MKQQQLKELKTGDIVRHFTDHRTYVVLNNYGERVTAVRNVDITNASEWVVVAKAEHTEQPT